MKDFRKHLKKNSKFFLSAGKLIVIPLFLYLIFFFVLQIHRSLERELQRYDLSSYSHSAPVAAYPILKNPYSPMISAQSAVIMDNDSKVFIYEKNSQLRFSMASTTKLMTAIVALEEFSLNDYLLVYTSGAEGSTIGLVQGERYSLEALLYAMLLPSANDAANSIADNYPGGRAAFVARMNEKAKELLLKDTVYGDPSGLHDSGNYTTARDLAMLASYALNNQTIATITGTKYKIITDSTENHQIPLENLNILLGINGVVGLKTGYTEAAGGVLTTVRKDSGHTQILVVMRSVDRFSDTRALLSLITGNLSYINPLSSPVSRLK